MIIVNFYVEAIESEPDKLVSQTFPLLNHAYALDALFLRARQNSNGYSYILSEIVKLKDIDLRDWLTRVLCPVANHKIDRFCELAPWRYASKAARQGAIIRYGSGSSNG